MKKMEKDVSNIIKELRHVHRLTQKDLADKLGVGRTTVVGYEKGTIKPSIDVIAKICKEFNLPMSLFLPDTANGFKYRKPDIKLHINRTILDIRDNKFVFKDNNLEPAQRVVLINALNNLVKTLDDLEQFL